MTACCQGNLEESQEISERVFVNDPEAREGLLLPLLNRGPNMLTENHCVWSRQMVLIVSIRILP